METTPATPIRQHLRELLDRADDAKLAANLEQIEGALRCPDWCIARHGLPGGDFTVHHGDTVQVNGYDGSVAVWLAQEDDKPAMVAVQGDAYLTAGEAQVLVGIILNRVSIALGDDE